MYSRQEGFQHKHEAPYAIEALNSVATYVTSYTVDGF